MGNRERQTAGPGPSQAHPTLWGREEGGFLNKIEMMTNRLVRHLQVPKRDRAGDLK